jgi:2-phospho-L-lactate guanylyltransferase
MWALVPVKELTISKQRLASVLDPAEREELMLAMLRDVLTAIDRVPLFDGVLLVSRSQQAQALAREFVNDVFVESAGSDHSRAVAEGNRYLIERYRVDSSLAISSDVPRVTAQDIRRIIEVHDRVTLAPNAAGEGTNAVLTSPPNAISYHFGPNSLIQHIASAESGGMSPSIVRIPNLAHDIDDPQDLEHAIRDLPSSFTRSFLDNSGIAARLSRPGRRAKGVPGVRSTAWT